MVLLKRYIFILNRSSFCSIQFKIYDDLNQPIFRFEIFNGSNKDVKTDVNQFSHCYYSILNIVIKYF